MTPRATTGALALAAGTAFGLAAVLLGLDRSSPAGIAQGSSWLLPSLFAVAGVGLLAIALRFALASPIALAVGFLGVALLVGLPSAGPWRALTPLAAAWLLAVAELASWSVDLRLRGLDAPIIYRRRIAAIVGLVALGLALGAVAETGLNPMDLDGLELTAVGLLGGVALVAFAAVLAWRLRGGPATEGDLPAAGSGR